MGTTTLARAEQVAAGLSPRRRAAGVGLLAAAVVVARVVVSGGANVLYAEDGLIFLAGAIHEGPGVIFENYAGYLHVAPRLLAELVALAPVAVYGTVMLLVAAACIGGLSVIVYAVAAERLPAAAAAVVALMMAVSPMSWWGAVGTIANLQWFLAYACIWIGVTRSRRFGPVVLVTALSSPLGLLVGPVVWRHWRWWVPGAAVQVAVIAAGARTSTSDLAVGALVEGAASVAGGPVVGSVAGAGLLALLVWMVVRSGRQMPRGLLALAAVFLGASIVAGGEVVPRYLILPQLLVWAAVAVASVDAPRRERMMVLVLGVIIAAAAFPASANRTAALVRDGCPVPVAPAEERWDFDCAVASR